MDVLFYSQREMGKTPWKLQGIIFSKPAFGAMMKMV
jgi:hypothetical protein